jgi:hypothetical protein
MSMQMTIVKIIGDGQDCTVYFNLTPVTGTTYVTAKGGDIVNFTTATQDATFEGGTIQIPSDQSPLTFDVWDASGNLAYTYLATIGTQSTCKVQILSSYGGELASGAYPATIKLQGVAVFNKNL